MEPSNWQRTERHIRDVNNLNDNILDNAPVAIHVIDRDFTVLKWNKYLEKSTAIKKADILGKNLLEVMPETRTSGRYENLLRVITNGEPFHELGQRVVRSVGAHKGEMRYQDVSIVPLLEQGEIIGAITILSDVTERKLAEEKMEQAELEIAQSRDRLAHFSRLQTLGGLASCIAHEISQPLTSIKGYLQSVLNRLQAGNVEPSKLVDILTRAKGQADRASDIIEHARARVKQHDIEFELLDLNQLVLETVKLAEIDLSISCCDLHLLLHDSPLTVRVDKIQIQSVIMNLLRNAIDAVGDSSSVDKTIDLVTSHEQGEITLAVVDRGAGVAVEDVEKIFEPFYSTRENGLGIGLDMCRVIMEAHGGIVCYSPGADGGAEFQLSFPAVQQGELSGD